jgi:hypothetical protein
MSVGMTASSPCVIHQLSAMFQQRRSVLVVVVPAEVEQPAVGPPDPGHCLESAAVAGVMQRQRGRRRLWRPRCFQCWCLLVLLRMNLAEVIPERLGVDDGPWRAEVANPVHGCHTMRSFGPFQKIQWTATMSGSSSTRSIFPRPTVGSVLPIHTGSYPRGSRAVCQLIAGWLQSMWPGTPVARPGVILVVFGVLAARCRIHALATILAAASGQPPPRRPGAEREVGTDESGPLGYRQPVWMASTIMAWSRRARSSSGSSAAPGTPACQSGPAAGMMPSRVQAVA